MTTGPAPHYEGSNMADYIRDLKYDIKQLRLLLERLNERIVHLEMSIEFLEK